MGVNAQTTVPKFTAGQVLTAAQQTEINTGIPVFATTTTRDAAFGGSNKVLAEGQFAYIEASNATQYYDGAAWQTVGGGLTLVKSQTIGSAVSSVTVTDAFSSTYENYRITVNGGAASATGYLRIQLGSATTNYYGSGMLAIYTSGNYNGLAIDGAASFLYAGRSDANTMMLVVDVLSPNLAKWTTMNALQINNDAGAFGTAFCRQESTTQFTAFTLSCSTGTMTGGTIRVYGYQNS